uniref:Uncharacterized protein n=1 Tax=Tanacetum cinerariifolium TaxID=118510 RepID=A0A699ICA6_TANCI|nr:hypothetical protein [Tanacetum cinerariifolium]
MRGSEYGEQDRKVAILYEYETFKAIEKEQLLDTYLRYLQVINDLKKCGYKKDNCELNYKFLNNLQPEWKYLNPFVEILYDESKYSIDDQPQSIQEDLNHQRMNDVYKIWIESRNELLNTMQSLCEMILQRDQAANLSNHTPEPSRRFNFICYYDADNEESTIPLNEIISQIPPSIVITPILPIMEPEDSLIMGDEDLRNITEKESDEFIKSSVEDLVPISRESEDTSDSDKECDFPFCDNSMIFSSPLFNVNDDFTSSNDESLPEEDFQEENFKIY